MTKLIHFAAATSYGIVAVNPAKYKDINCRGAMRLNDWITAPEGQARIGSFEVDSQQLFFPSAAK